MKVWCAPSDFESLPFKTKQKWRDTIRQHQLLIFDDGRKIDIESSEQYLDLP